VKKYNNSNDAREALLQTLDDLKSQRPTNLDEVTATVKVVEGVCGLHDRHLAACRVNGKSSRKQNAGWNSYETEAATAEQQAKAKAKAERDEVEGASAEQVALTTEIVKTERQLVNALKGDQRLKRVKTKVGNLRAKVSQLEDQLAKTKRSRQTV
jgi:hypothetical protein